MLKAPNLFAEIQNKKAITAGILAKERNLLDADYCAVMRELKKQLMSKISLCLSMKHVPHATQKI